MINSICPSCHREIESSGHACSRDVLNQAMKDMLVKGQSSIAVVSGEKYMELQSSLKEARELLSLGVEVVNRLSLGKHITTESIEDFTDKTKLFLEKVGK